MNPDDATVIRSLDERDDTRNLPLVGLDLPETGPRHAVARDRSAQAKVAAGLTAILVAALCTGYGAYRYGSWARREPAHASLSPAPSPARTPEVAAPVPPSRSRSPRPDRSRPRAVPVPPTTREPRPTSPTPSTSRTMRPPKPTPCPTPTSPRPSRTPSPSATPSPTHTWTFPDGDPHGR